MKRLALHQVSKSFGALRALDAVDIEIEAGRIHALVGENGAGKSTLVRILTGVERPDRGSVSFGDGSARPLEFDSPATARAMGIGVVHQHDTLIDAFTIEENLALSQSRSLASTAASSAFREHVRLPESARLAYELSVGERQRVEIARALAFDPRILILDEPTAVLAPPEAAALLDEMRALAARGVGIVFISHFLDEVLAVADRITVLRRGRVVARANRGEIDRERLAIAMVGDALPAPNHVAAESRDVRLSVRSLSTDERFDAPALRDVAFEVRGGECVAIAGVAGNGQRALAAVLSGRQRPYAGQVLIEGELVADPRLPLRRSRKIAVVPEDRRSEGLALELSIAENLLLCERVLAATQRGALLPAQAVRRLAEDAIAKFAIHGATPSTPVGALSGGNQQRVILARELLFDPPVALLVQPTRGLDVKATAYVHSAVEAIRLRGGAVVLISTDLDEVMAMADRILVLSRGRVVADLPRGSSSAEVGRAFGGGYP